MKGRGNVLEMPVGGQEEKGMASYTVYMDVNGIMVVCMGMSPMDNVLARFVHRE